MKRTDYISWDEYFMGIAMLAARRSKDPSTQVGNPKRRGNQYINVVVETPTKLTKEQKELLRKLDDTMEVKSNPKRKKFFDTVKDFFD